ncbi:MAG: bifunctional glutamate N-acetyltransferase/amino-acid acetyltransferase ArgJ [Gammaproteobacteria bacterium]
MSNSDSLALSPVAGIRLATVSAGIKKQDRKDLVVIELAEGTTVTGVFTRNAFCAAPVIVARDHLSKASSRYLVINTGNANAGTGEQGIQDALATCQKVAEETGCETEQVLPFSTGVIGENLPLDRLLTGVTAACKVFDDNGWNDAAQGIMTTDTVAKGYSTSLDIAGKKVEVTGIAKGSGMIRPDMATMLAYIATDAEVSQTDLQGCLKNAVARSFNRITVDGDTSTNDACILMATGQSGVEIKTGSNEYELLVNAIQDICIDLARAMVKDGEGATKLINIVVEQGKSQQECLDVAYTVAHSPLVKTAFFACDPNWGRILAAVGRSGIEDLDLNNIEIYLDDVCIVENGGRSPSYTESQGQAVMDKPEITITIKLSRGDFTETVWTCDFSYDYVKINAEYRT